MRYLRPRFRLVPILGVTLLLGLAACSGSDTSKVASLGDGPNGSDSVNTEPVDTQEALLAYAACMRDNGIDMPDPQFDADGNVSGRIFGPNSGIDPRSTEFQDAQKVCGKFLEGVDFGGGRAGRFDREAIQAALMKFTSCLRDHGLDVDDITLPTPGQGGGGGNATPGSGSAPPRGFNGGPNGAPPNGSTPNGPGGQGFNPVQRLITRLGLDETDPKVKAAVSSCQAIIENAFTTTTTAG